MYGKGKGKSKREAKDSSCVDAAIKLMLIDDQIMSYFLKITDKI